MANKRRPTRSASKATPARKAAYEILKAARLQDTYISAVSPAIYATVELTHPDKAFTQLLTHGVVSVQTALDELIDSALRSPKDIQPDVRDALRLATYEIIYLHKEDHAAVDQGVELVRSFAPRATGVANYVLHRVVEAKDHFPGGDPTESLDVAARYYGFPEWLAKQIKKNVGRRNALCLMEESVKPAPVWFSVNENRVPVTKVISELEMQGIEFNTTAPLIERGNGFETPIFQLADRGNVGNPAFLNLLTQEQIVVSDLSAQSIVRMVASLVPQNQVRVLEVGAGRGTKTVQLQSLLKERGVEIASYDVLDISAKKLKLLQKRIAEAGGRIDHAFAHDATKELPGDLETYDLIFVDAPCTGVGTLRRHPEIKARLKEADSKDLACTNSLILKNVASLVKPGGHFVYATCTLFDQENDKVINRFRSTDLGKAFELVPIGKEGTPYFKTPIVPNGPDIHFAAALKRV